MMNKIDIIRKRLFNQGIVFPFNKIEDAVNNLGAIQAQDYNAAIWALGLRLNNLTSTDIENVFNSGEILRTHILRPTWHFVLAKDIKWMLKLTAPFIKKAMSYNDRSLGLDDNIFSKSNKIIVEALNTEKQLTRTELIKCLKNSGINIDANRPSHMFMRAELEGLICSGAKIGKLHSFTLLDRLDNNKILFDGDEALAELANRYFKSHGPATQKDFSWWSGLPLNIAKKAINIIHNDLVEYNLEGTIYFSNKGNSDSTSDFNCNIFIPNYDELFVSYTDKSLYFDKQAVSEIVNEKNILLRNTVLLDGKISGAWRRIIKKDVVEIEIQSLFPFTKKQYKLVDTAARKYAEFYKKTLNIKFK